MVLRGRAFFVSLLKATVGMAVIAFAAILPAYFTRVDKRAVIAAGEGTSKPIGLSKLYFDSSKISCACIMAESAAEGDKIVPLALKLTAKKPSLGISGGDEPFFDAFLSTLPKNILTGANRALRAKSDSDEFPITPVYEMLSLGESRERLAHFLKQSSSPFVKKILTLKDLNTTVLPPVYSGAGAPLESAVLTLALLAQSGDFNDRFLREFSVIPELAPSEPEIRAKFEKFALSVLYFERNCDWTLFRSIFSNFPDMTTAYDFARVSRSAGDASRIVTAALLMSGNTRGICDFLREDSDRGDKIPQRLKDLTFAYLNGEGSLSFILENQKSIHRPHTYLEKFETFCEPLVNFFAPIAAQAPNSLAWLKLALAAVGGWILLGAIGGIIGFKRGRQSVPLSVIQGAMEGLLVAVVFLFAVEPSVFEIKFGSEVSPELKFAFAQNINNLGKEIMNIQLDSATMIAVLAFLVLQFVVYIFCIARLSYVKRTKLPADIKFRLLENEDNLFDLNLYVGLTGTVMSLIFLAMNIVSASLMAAYSSTLFGIIFTAIFKIGHLRPYRRRLILESRAENDGKSRI